MDGWIYEWSSRCSDTVSHKTVLPGAQSYDLEPGVLQEESVVNSDWVYDPWDCVISEPDSSAWLQMSQQQLLICGLGVTAALLLSWSPKSEGLASSQPLLIGIPLLPTIILVTVPLYCVVHGVLIITEQEERRNDGEKDNTWAFGMNHKWYRANIVGYSIKLRMCRFKKCDCRQAALVLHHASFWLVFP